MGFTKRALERGYAFSDKTICSEHIDDPVLKTLISDCATESSCSYCGTVGTDDAPVAALFDDFMDGFMNGVRLLYVRGREELPSDCVNTGTGMLRSTSDEGQFVGATIYNSDEVAEMVLSDAMDDYLDDMGGALLADIQAVLLADDWVARDWFWLSPSDRLLRGWGGFRSGSSTTHGSGSRCDLSATTTTPTRYRRSSSSEHSPSCSMTIRTFTAPSARAPRSTADE